MPDAWGARRTIVVVGGGFSGTLFALAASLRPGLDVVLVEREAQAGLGLAYGACEGCHVLNVPVARMEVGLVPSFTSWLQASGADLSAALAEAGGELSQAFVPRGLFGAYMVERLEQALAGEGGEPPRLRRVRGEVVQVVERPSPGVVLADGRRIEAAQVVLATGNLPPKPPRGRDGWFYDTPHFIPDPWDARELGKLDPDAPLVLIGTGLTMVDVALKLSLAGHRGPLVAVSRHGLVPAVHQAGGSFEPFLTPEAAPTPVAGLRAIRAAVRKAAAAGVPWHRVMDAVRPAIAAVWSHWPLAEKARFLRHARTYWDVHRHRMAPRIATGFAALTASGQVRTVAGRIAGYQRRPGGVTVSVRHRGAATVERLDVAAVLNCTGPRSDFGDIGLPLFARLREAGRIVPDALGLGLESHGCALVDRYGFASDWLYALGPLTRPAWWEITAVPEITAQVHRLVEELAAGDKPAGADGRAALLADFVNLGEGI
ncbi:FAD/NAD(P)-binding protein [Xanthobacter sp. V4C-4]|uniref:FAD/NAD(P)-binding protein n=1 Tax=Xanthobacter cornucopiae TaxID=3119924 RepID=UPI00372AE5D9